MKKLMCLRPRDMAITPERAFQNQKKRAAGRGIAWLLTFEQWMAIWERSGKLHLRGRKKGQYVMSRLGDAGPYSVENVAIIEAGQNHGDAYRHKKWRNGRPAGSGKGWSINKSSKSNPFVAQFRGVKIGVFPTEEAARAAYLEAAQKNLAGDDPTSHYYGAGARSD